MGSIHHSLPTLISLTFLNVLRLTYSIENWQTVHIAESTTSTAVIQQTFEITGNYSSTEALLNVTIPFINDDCTNPVVEIYREAVDYNVDDEFLDFFFGAYDNESLIFRCERGPDEQNNECGAFLLCGVFEFPVGDYSMLELFIFQPDTVLAQCGNSDDEEGPLRSLGVRFVVSCEVEIECEEESEEEDESGSSSESREAAVRIENERVDHEVEHMEPKQMKNIPVRIDCNSDFNFLMRFVLGIGACWIAQCALFCQYKKN